MERKYNYKQAEKYLEEFARDQHANNWWKRLRRKQAKQRRKRERDSGENVSIGVAAFKTGHNRRTIWTWAQKGEIRATRKNRKDKSHWRVSVSDIASKKGVKLGRLDRIIEMKMQGCTNKEVAELEMIGKNLAGQMWREWGQDLQGRVLRMGRQGGYSPEMIGIDLGINPAIIRGILRGENPLKLLEGSKPRDPKCHEEMIAAVISRRAPKRVATYYPEKRKPGVMTRYHEKNVPDFYQGYSEEDLTTMTRALLESERKKGNIL